MAQSYFYGFEVARSVVGIQFSEKDDHVRNGSCLSVLLDWAVPPNDDVPSELFYA